MKVLVLCSKKKNIKKDIYSIESNTVYVNKFLNHIKNQNEFCFACGKGCIHCRQKLLNDQSDSIKQVIDFPSITPAIIDEPEEYLPADIPEHDILIAISINEEILLSFIKKFPISKGIIVPIEDPDWISPHIIKEINNFCKIKKIEISFPKPFCSFNPDQGILFEFKKKFKIGLPEIKFKIKNEKIIKSEVKFSAPCGATYFTARGLEGKNINEDLEFFIDKQISAYPCTASTKIDREFRDSIIHKAVNLQKLILKEIK